MEKSEGKGQDAKRIYSIFTHPLRAKIIELLGTKGPLGFTDLKAETQAGVGTLYYHISVLGELVVQGRDKRYSLSETGRLAHQLLIKGPNIPMERLQDSPSRGISPFISGSFIFHFMSQSPEYHVPWTLAIIIIGAWASMIAGLRPGILFLFESNAPQTQNFVIFLISWLVVLFLTMGIATIAFGSKGGNLSLLATSAFAYLPIVLFALVWLFSKSFPSLTQAFDGWPIRILFFALQGWSLVLLASALRVSKGLSATESALTVLSIAYLSAAFIIVGGRI